MSKFLINGGKKLFGDLHITAAKNAYLPILAACVLCEDKITLHNYPYYSDTESMCKILSSLGALISCENGDLTVDASSLFSWGIKSELASQVRSSIFMLGALLGRFKKARVAYPGGCEIGARPIDIHLAGFRKLGVVVEEKHGFIQCDASNMHSGKILLEFPSVGATESLMMASVLTNGVTHILNAAKEPEIVDLCNYLLNAGADISNAGTDTIIINGVEELYDNPTGYSNQWVEVSGTVGTIQDGEIYLFPTDKYEPAIPVRLAEGVSEPDELDNVTVKGEWRGTIGEVDFHMFLWAESIETAE